MKNPTSAVRPGILFVTQRWRDRSPFGRGNAISTSSAPTLSPAEADRFFLGIDGTLPLMHP
jgi:hypothetical protein